MTAVRRICSLAVMAAIVGVAWVACAGSAARAEDEPGTYAIVIKDFAFSPRNLVIPAGSKVAWKNEDEEPHRVVEVNNSFASQPLDTEDAFSYEFKAAGTYEYFCSLHPHMTGKIVVEEKQPSN